MISKTGLDGYNQMKRLRIRMRYRDIQYVVFFKGWKGNEQFNVKPFQKHKETLNHLATS